MKKYEVYTLAKFDKEISKLPPDYQDQIKNIFLQLAENPYVGDQIQYRFFREKRIREKRIFYLIYDDLSAVLLVAVSGKKAQQETINQIKRYFDDYRKYMAELLSKKG